MSRKSKQPTQQLRQETNYQGAFLTPPRTEEEAALAEWSPDRSLLDAGMRTTFGKRRQDASESLAGITNPYAKARAENILQEEIAGEEASALTEADERRNEMILRNKQYLAGLRRPQYIQQKTSGFNEQFQPQGGGGTLQGIGGIAQGAGLMAAAL